MRPRPPLPGVLLVVVTRAFFNCGDSRLLKTARVTTQVIWRFTSSLCSMASSPTSSSSVTSVAPWTLWSLQMKRTSLVTRAFRPPSRPDASRSESHLESFLCVQHHVLRITWVVTRAFFSAEVLHCLVRTSSVSSLVSSVSSTSLVAMTRTRTSGSLW